MAQCPFCAIAAGERPAHRLDETDRTLAFLDRNPAVEGHALVVPKRHRAFLFTEDASVATAVFEGVRRLVWALDRTLEPDGVSLFYTSADLVGTVAHAHVHVLPRYDGDDIHLALARGSLDEAAAARLAERVRANR